MSNLFSFSQQDVTYTHSANLKNTRVSRAVSADFDGDGNDDLVVMKSQEDGVTFAKGNGNGLFAFPGVSIMSRSQMLTFSGNDLCTTDIVVGDFNGDGKPDMSVFGYGDQGCDAFTGNYMPMLTFLNIMEWPTTTPLITGTSTTETATITSTTRTETSTTGTMFELVTGTTDTESSTTVTEYTTTETAVLNNLLSKENADLLVIVNELAGRLSQLENNQNTDGNINDFGENNRNASIGIEIASMAVAAVALVVGTAALFFALRSQKSLQIEKTTELTNIITNDGFAGADTYVDIA